MKKTIAAFLLGGLFTAGALGLVYELPIISAAENTAQTQCGEAVTTEANSKATGTYCN